MIMKLTSRIIFTQTDVFLYFGLLACMFVMFLVSSSQYQRCKFVLYHSGSSVLLRRQCYWLDARFDYNPSVR